MVRKLYISPLARKDLESIFHYGMTEFGYKSTVLFLDKFEKAFSQLCDFDLGLPCDYVLPNLYRYVVERYVVFYFRTTEEIKIIRILHGSQDVKNKF
ncbi:type II toxin-antitoxin system RelE/ParE family toxin [Aggregatibacter actinomycetemcomitans]|nr:type II toxin-antitoxin system RelE/ParE family toxin [Aggregatibacter actinomycetemcomitans]KYK73110.1 plasmid stabilization protein [Aggregatibacter actinomycetemcomitans serotype e str. SA3096]KYK82804.1 plasmid stabilization protein [Aggregatibacter actinomycetemcomitans serotype e str. SC936]TYB21609.1 type II toxin-antitoxin system RelE/ParE family toxin [Aggregatibacter actinomycetemcomitans]